MLPDWVLVEVAGTLTFPDVGAPRFGDAELLAPTLGLWEPQGDVRQLGSAALYVLPSEAVLGATRDRLLAAPVVALLHTGALLVSLLLLDRARLVLTG